MKNFSVLSCLDLPLLILRVSSIRLRRTGCICEDVNSLTICIRNCRLPGSLEPRKVGLGCRKWVTEGVPLGERACLWPSLLLLPSTPCPLQCELPSQTLSATVSWNLWNSVENNPCHPCVASVRYFGHSNDKTNTILLPEGSYPVPGRGMTAESTRNLSRWAHCVCHLQSIRRR